MMFVASTILLLFTAPPLGIMADKRGRKYAISAYNYRTCVLFVYPYYHLSHNLAPEWVPLRQSFSFSATLLTSFSFSFLHPHIQQLASPEKRGWIFWYRPIGKLDRADSRYLSRIIHLQPVHYFFSTSQVVRRHFSPHPLFLSPFLCQCFCGFKNEENPQIIPEKISYREACNFQSVNLKNFTECPELARFCLGFSFSTMRFSPHQTIFPIYLERVFGVTDQVKTYLTVGILVTTAIGALIGGKIGDKVRLRKTMLFIWLAWVVIFPLLHQHFFPRFLLVPRL
jgi:MFS family permease